jgi:prepilin-type N-terminal cleavage/methylation domain-containing protein
MQKSGLYGWFNKNLRGKKGQQGFTLIELLVVVTILGVLAAIVTLSLVGLTTNANIQSCNTEYKTVQSALDAYMADKQLASIPSAPVASGKWTNDMSNGTTIPPQAASNTHDGTVPLWISNPTASNPNYTRNGTTQFYYQWDTTGKITSIATDAGGTQLSACVPK